jgi:hypothetical protein
VYQEFAMLFHTHRHFPFLQEQLPDPTPADLAREAEMEVSVFSASRNIERLLEMLSQIDPQRDSFSENESIQVGIM